MTETLKLAVLLSGNGSNLQALIDACAVPGFPAEIAVVLSNKADAYGLERAKQAGIATEVVSHKDYPDRESFDRAMHARLVAYAPGLVCLAGFMRLVSPWFVQQWHNKMINIHPSLLPSFKGMDTHQRALDAGVKLTGCTVHFVRDDMDVGPIIIQAAVPILTSDTVAHVQNRVLYQEHRIYAKAVEWFARGWLDIVDEVVQIKKEATPDDAASFLHSF